MGADFIPTQGPGAVLVVDWTYSFPNPASAAAAVALTNTSIEWSLTCTEAGVTLVGPSSTNIAFAAGQARYDGTTELLVRATPDTPGLQKLPCRLQGEAGRGSQTLHATGFSDFEPSVAFTGNLTFTTPTPQRMAGPQKQIPYAIEIVNEGNARVIVRWELVDAPGGRWNILLPDRVTVDPGQSTTAIVTVLTPFDNGYNKGATEFQVRANPAAAEDPNLLGPTTDLILKAQVKGWYVPGPSPAVLLAGLALLGLTVRRRME